jgi:hypothetical protein
MSNVHPSHPQLSNLILVCGKLHNASQINLQLVHYGPNRNFGFPKLNGRSLDVTADQLSFLLHNIV